MDTPLKQTIHQLVEQCEDIHRLTHIKLLLESKKATRSLVQETAIQYETPSIKQFQKEIAILVDEENDIDFLQDIKNEFDPNYVDNFDNLSPEDRKDLLELIQEPFGKDTISHEEFLKSMARWDTK